MSLWKIKCDHIYIETSLETNEISKLRSVEVPVNFTHYFGLKDKNNTKTFTHTKYPKC